MTGNEIRRRFLEHFASREHKVLPSASLVPHADPSTLFISAGMQPLKPYYLGLSDPPAPRLASCQKCLRTGDIDEVGKTDRHNTFFEMLGNFSPTGDYFKETAIPLAWDLVTEVFGMPVDRLRVTIHPTDDEAHDIWSRQPGMTAERITRLEDNWWGLGAGPCGPDSEIWWDRGKEFGCGQDDCVPDHCERFTEFWNLVFPQYDQRGPLEGTSGEAVRRALAEGSLVPLARPAIDTGMGLERISYILQGKTNIFEADILEPLVAFVRSASPRPTTLSERIVADHLRAATFVIADGVTPSNEGRGYVLRRLIRRAAIHGRKMGLTANLSAGVGVAVAMFKDHYPELQKSEKHITEVVQVESDRFNRTLEQGMEQFEKIAAQHAQTIPGADAFRLHDTYGFPLELTHELAAERGIEVDEAGFRTAMEEQRARSRRGTPQGWALAKDLPKSEFTGYHELTTREPGGRAAQGRQAGGGRQRRRRGGSVLGAHSFLCGVRRTGRRQGNDHDGAAARFVSRTRRSRSRVRSLTWAQSSPASSECARARSPPSTRGAGARSRVTIRRRTCSTRRCAKRSARASCRRARGSAPTTPRSTSP